MVKTVVIVGRPNVGKSTLFNRLVGRRQAIVDDTPGVTRDWREGAANLAGLEFRVVDTAGLEEAFDDSMQGRMRQHTERIVAEADLVIFLYDVRAGITPLDEHFADWLRRCQSPVVVVANKCEGTIDAARISEAYALGLGAPVVVSAEHNEGMADLFAAIVAWIGEEDSSEEPEEERASPPLQLAIVGRPNVGKSTLINQLVGEERMLTGPEAGLTRDAISVDWSYKGDALRLVDTAGLRRRTRVSDDLERRSVEDAQRAIRFAHVVVLVLDANMMLERQDLSIARQIIEEGRALVIAANKWDVVADKKKALSRLQDRLMTSLPQVRSIRFVTISALKGQNLEKLLDTVFCIYDAWNRRVPTARLNIWLEAAIGEHPPPMSSGRRIRLRYITQVKARPPTFAIWATRFKGLPDSYMRFLANRLRDEFDLDGIPLRLLLRQGHNPYAKGARN
jgi:GTP-binding protein